ncbi:MAG TPA: hypothetical protein VFO60_11475 [Candidatus Dormibacteraeota bacterium]|nr:hypothetical protein [Candidatus Dormibacteraeota bacterium]
MKATSAAPPGSRTPRRGAADSAAARVRAVLLQHPWPVVLAVTAALVAAYRLAALGSVPPGLHYDEASVGYNAWTIAHHGVDEHGNVMPLYFEAFGEFKNPVYIYLLAPFTWVLPLTPATIRLPAALCGLAIVASLTALAWQVTRSRAATLLTLVVAGFTPWLAIESRVGFEVVSQVAALAVGTLCIARGLEAGARRGWLWAGGALHAAAVLAYTTGRLYVGLLLLTLAAVDRRWRPSRALLPVHAPVAAVYAMLCAYALTGGGQSLVHRFGQLWIGSDNAGPVLVAVRFARNDLTYWGVPFLFTNGDSNLRHNPGYGGMLLVTTLPAIVAGGWFWWRRGDMLSRLLLCGAALAPVPAALTADGTPHGLRSAVMAPFLLAIAAPGWAVLAGLLASRRGLAALAVVAVAVDVGGSAWDLMVRYPNRVEAVPTASSGQATTTLEAFDAGELDAISRAHAAAGGHIVWLSDRLDEPGEEALVALTPPPRSTGSVEGDRAAELAEAGAVEQQDAGAIGSLAGPCDILVLAPDESAPPGSTELFSESWELQPDAETINHGRMLTTVRVWRAGGCPG